MSLAAMSFSRAALKRFNDGVTLSAGPADYDPKDVGAKKASAALITKGKRSG